MAAHAIVVPYPGQGHINPMMQLAKKIASLGISVTFVLTESWHTIITQPKDNAFTHATTLGLHITPGIIPDCVPGESQRWGNFIEFFLSLSNMEAHVSQLIRGFNQSETPVTCMVADTFLKWAAPFAKRQGLLFVSLWPMSVTSFSIFYHSDLVKLEGCTDCIPGVPPLQRTQLPSPLTSPSTLSEEFALCLVNVREADWIVANSFYALDCRAVEAMRHKTPLQCVGPLLPSAYFDQTDCRDRKVGTSSHAETDCSEWLHSKTPRSVIYVSFGSFIPVSRPQIWEIALGLMASGYSFVWALRPDKEASHVLEMLPPGYWDESKKQGFVAPWFSQVEVLSHPSVGGFLSHCGWNAVMESVLSGVPMLGFPLAVDQFTNCKLVADEWKFGLKLRNGDDENRVITAEEITKKVKMLMEGEESVRLRGAAERFRELAKEEVINGGGSAINMEALCNSLKEATNTHDFVVPTQVNKCRSLQWP